MTWALFDHTGEMVGRYTGGGLTDTQQFTKAQAALRANCDAQNGAYLQQVTDTPPYTPTGDRYTCADLPPVEPEDPPGTGE